MKRSPKIRVPSALLRKLRQNAGYTEEEVARKLGVKVDKITKVEHEEDSFTLTQLKKLTEIYKVPLTAFFSDDIPDVPSLPDYRINRDRRLGPDVFIAIRKAKYLSEEIEALSGKKSEIPSFPEAPPEELARMFREYLKIKPTESTNPLETLSYYKRLLSNALKIIIIEYPLKADDVRAFSMRLGISIIVLNESDRPQIKLFSLLHEIAHLLKGNNGICSLDLEESKEGIEKFCNMFAAEFLVPSDDLRKRIYERVLSDNEISKLANSYGVSKQVMMLKLLDLRYITKEDYYKFKNRFEESKLKKKGGRRDWEKTYSNRIGDLVLTEINNAYRSGEISFFEAARILDVNTKYAEKLLG